MKPYKLVKRRRKSSERCYLCKARKNRPCTKPSGSRRAPHVVWERK